MITTNLQDDTNDSEAYEQVRDRALGGPGALRSDLLVDRIGVASRSRLHEMCRVVPMEHENDFRKEVRRVVRGG